MDYNLFKNGIYWGYNPLTNHLLTFLGHPSGTVINCSILEISVSFRCCGSRKKQPSSLFLAGIHPKVSCKNNGLKVFPWPPTKWAPHPVTNGVITPISRASTPGKPVYFRPFIGAPSLHWINWFLGPTLYPVGVWKFTMESPIGITRMSAEK